MIKKSYTQVSLLINLLSDASKHNEKILSVNKNPVEGFFWISFLKIYTLDGLCQQLIFWWFKVLLKCVFLLSCKRVTDESCKTLTYPDPTLLLHLIPPSNQKNNVALMLIVWIAAMFLQAPHFFREINRRAESWRMAHELCQGCCRPFACESSA